MFTVCFFSVFALRILKIVTCTVTLYFQKTCYVFSNYMEISIHILSLYVYRLTTENKRTIDLVCGFSISSSVVAYIETQRKCFYLLLNGFASKHNELSMEA